MSQSPGIHIESAEAGGSKSESSCCLTRSRCAAISLHLAKRAECINFPVVSTSTIPQLRKKTLKVAPTPVVTTALRRKAVELCRRRTGD
jgi:hypothetical protein